MENKTMMSRKWCVGLSGIALLCSFSLLGDGFFTVPLSSSRITVDGKAGPAMLELLAALAADPGQPVEISDTLPDESTVIVKRNAIEAMLSEIEAMRQQLDGMAYVARGWIE